ncbi:MAG: CopD family protein [Hyphomonadaceae bacterium]
MTLAVTWLWIAFGLVLFGASVFPFYGGATGAAQRLRVIPFAALGMLVFGTLAVIGRAMTFGAAPQQLLVTSIGRIWMVQIVVGVVSVALASRRRRDTRISALATINICGFALAGHANAISGWLGAAVQAVHLLAAGAWIGGLVALLFALREQPSAASVRRFSRVGIICVVLLAVSGACMLFINTGAWLPITYMAYGKLAAVKITLFAVALALAVFNRFYATTRGAWSLLIRAIGAELGILALILGAAVTLASLEPYG